MQKLIFSNQNVSIFEPHSGGGCKLPESISWPQDTNGEALLHLATFPASWLDKGAALWVSIFIPYKTGDIFHHWDVLAVTVENTSTVIIHSNKGEEKNPFFGLKTEGKAIQLDLVCSSEEEFISKISENIDWLQDEDEFAGLNCKAMINGNDFDFAFGGDVGMFSGGFVYLFMPKEDKYREGVSCAKITFQFS